MKPITAAATDSRKNSGNRTEPLGNNSEIGRKLKQYYDGLVSEEVPDRFADLLRRLEDSETSTSAAREGE